MVLSENAKKFLEMSPEDIIRLQRKISACLLAQEESEAIRGWKQDTLGENLGEAVGDMMCARITKRDRQPFQFISRETSIFNLVKSTSSQTLQLSAKSLKKLEMTSKEILDLIEEGEVGDIEGKENVEKEDKVEEKKVEDEKIKEEENIKEEEKVGDEKIKEEEKITKEDENIEEDRSDK
jgi:hypothetical protein